MTFLKDFDANHLVVFPPNRRFLTDASFKAMCDGFNKIGEAAGEMGFQAGLHNHMGEMVQTTEEIDRCMAMTDPKLFHFSPDTAHLYLADCDVVKILDKHKSRLMLLDYKDAKKIGDQNHRNCFRSRRRRCRLPRLPPRPQIHQLQRLALRRSRRRPQRPPRLLRTLRRLRRQQTGADLCVAQASRPAVAEPFS